MGYSVNKGAETAWSRARRSNEDAVLLWARLYVFVSPSDLSSNE